MTAFQLFELLVVFGFMSLCLVILMGEVDRLTEKVKAYESGEQHD